MFISTAAGVFSFLLTGTRNGISVIPSNSGPGSVQPGAKQMVRTPFRIAVICADDKSNTLRTPTLLHYGTYDAQSVCWFNAEPNVLRTGVRCQAEIAGTWAPQLREVPRPPCDHVGRAQRSTGSKKERKKRAIAQQIL